MTESPLTGLTRTTRGGPPRKGPLLVLAGAGSGKTRVITHRLARLVETGADPRAILAVTFTNKAAEEMRERARQPARRRRPLLSFIGTFHAWSLRLLRRYAARGERPAALRDRRRPPTSSPWSRKPWRSCRSPTRSCPPGAVRARISRPRTRSSRRSSSSETQTDFAGERIAQVYRPLREEARGGGRARLRRPDRALRAPPARAPDILGARSGAASATC